jgi:hypothetical protein
MLRRLPINYHVALIGRGYQTGDQLDGEWGAYKRLHFIDAVPAAQVSSFISTADVGLLLRPLHALNDRFALPNGFFHLVDAGLPVARFPLPEVESIIRQRPTGPRLAPHDPVQAAACITEFLEDPEAVQSARAAVRHMAEELLWEAQEGVLAKIVGLAEKENCSRSEASTIATSTD